MHQFLADLNIHYQTDVPLAPLTWCGLGGPARILATPSSIQQLSTLLARCHDEQIPVYILGSGANLLVRDEGVDGLVVQLSDPAFGAIRPDDDGLSVGAGCDLGKLVLHAAKAGRAGLEGLAGIPATVGGAVRMNAGGSFGEIGRAVRRIQVIDAAGQVYYRDRDDLHFGYRHTNIDAKVIAAVDFELTEQDPAELIQQVKRVFLYKKNTQPLGERSAGCTFKNPTPPTPSVSDDDASQAEPAAETATWPAGKLIDEAGLKGHRIGGAHVSDRHANFILIDPGATAADVLALIDHIRDTVADKFNVTLHRELVLW